MAVEDIQIEAGNEGDDTAKELTQLKKEMAERIVDNMRKQNKDFMLLFGKYLVTDYLIDEGDNVKDFLLGLGINKFSEFSDQLNDLREKIKLVESKQELDALEKSVLESLGLSANNEPSNNESSDNEEKNPQKNSKKKDNKSDSVTGVTTGVGVTASAKKKDNPDNNPGSVESVPVGEAAEIPLKDRMNWLFPDGVPTKEKEMKKYITTIKVPIRTPEGKKKTLSLRIHKKLSSEYKAIFKEMYNKGIPVNPDSTGGYTWRKMRRGKKISHHSYGTAVDVNWDVNGGVYGRTEKTSPYYNGKETVDIRKRHGFYWGGDWSSKSNDPMHFTYMNA